MHTITNKLGQIIGFMYHNHGSLWEATAVNAATGETRFLGDEFGYDEAKKEIKAWDWE